ncbi:MAG: sigma-70 family RNA polymerase sigma factor, partial [Actinobacteria bacterium]|nr:sigma-70 family RNA polymerase sigma factor [Actinomycetota bacterium]
MRADTGSSDVEGHTAIDIDAVYRAHHRRLLGLAAAITLDRQSAEEVVHDAFEGLHRARGRVERPEAYLQRSVINLAINRQRRWRTAARHPAAPPPPASTPEIDETWQAVVSLPPKQRAVVALRFWHDMTIESIADTLGWPVGSVKSTLHRALERLKEDLRCA